MICATGIPRVEQTDQRLRWGLRQSWAEDVQACFDCQGHSQSCNFPLSETTFLKLKKKKKNCCWVEIFY